MTRQTVCRYFTNIDELLIATSIAAADAFLDRMLAHIAEFASAPELIAEAIAYILEQLPDEPHLSLLLCRLHLHPRRHLAHRDGDGPGHPAAVPGGLGRGRICRGRSGWLGGVHAADCGLVHRGPRPAIPGRLPTRVSDIDSLTLRYPRLDGFVRASIALRHPSDGTRLPLSAAQAELVDETRPIARTSVSRRLPTVRDARPAGAGGRRKRRHCLETAPVRTD